MPSNNQAIIVGAMGFVTLTSVVKVLSEDTTKRFPPLKVVFGGFVATLALLTFSEVEPQLASAFAILVAVSTGFSERSAPIIKVVNKLTAASGTNPVPKTIDPGVTVGVGGNSKVS